MAESDFIHGCQSLPRDIRQVCTIILCSSTMIRTFSSTSIVDALQRMGCRGYIWYVSLFFLNAPVCFHQITALTKVCIHTAWAHLILYGDEATKLAQKEGEEAAAAYELEKRDIAEGKIPESPAKPDKKKKSLTPRPTGKSSDIDAIPASAASGDEGESTHSKKRKAGPRESLSGDKKARNNCRIPKTEKDLMVLSLSKGVLKVRYGRLGRGAFTLFGRLTCLPYATGSGDSAPLGV